MALIDHTPIGGPEDAEQAHAGANGEPAPLRTSHCRAAANSAHRRSNLESAYLSSGGYSHGYSDPSRAGADRLQDDSCRRRPTRTKPITHWQNLEWATEHSMMVCRRNEIQLFDPVEGHEAQSRRRSRAAAQSQFCRCSGNARAPAFGLPRTGTTAIETRPGVCGGSAARLRSWTRGQEPLIGYKLPECGHRDTVICETDSVI